MFSPKIIFYVNCAIFFLFSLKLKYKNNKSLNKNKSNGITKTINFVVPYNQTFIIY